MKILLKVHEPLNREYFMPAEEIRGCAELGGCSMEKIQSLQIRFQGKLKVSFAPEVELEPRQIHEPRLQKRTYILFDETKSIQPDSGGPVLDGGLCLVPFLFRFPKNAPCCNRQLKAESLLPPTFNLHTRHLRVQVTYSILVNVSRPGLFRRRLRARHELMFDAGGPAITAQSCWEPRPPMSLEFARNTAMLPASRLGGPSDEVRPSFFGMDRVLVQCLPAYSPALILEVMMQQPVILSRGDAPARVRLVVQAPHDLREIVGGIRVRSVAAKLRITTEAIIGRQSRKVVVYRPMWNIIGDITVDQEQIEIDFGVLQNCSAPADVTPSFQSCAVRRSYAIEVVMGVCSTRQPEVQYLVTTTEAVIINPPPSYSLQSNSPIVPCPVTALHSSARASSSDS